MTLPIIDLAYVKSRLEKQALGNLGGELLQEVDRIFHINTAKDYIFSYLTALGPWYWSKKIETFVAADQTNGDNVWNLASTPTKFWIVKDPDDKQHRTLKYQQVAFGYIEEDQDQRDTDDPVQDDRHTKEFMLTGEQRIETEIKYKNLKVVYSRLSNWQENLSDQIDMPVSLIGALHFIALKFAISALMSEGVQLSNSFDGIGDKMLQTYAINQGMVNAVKGFSVSK